jgi:hypothetical protein
MNMSERIGLVIRKKDIGTYNITISMTICITTIIPLFGVGSFSVIVVLKSKYIRNVSDISVCVFACVCMCVILANELV